MIQREKPSPEATKSLSAVMTIGVEDYDSIQSKIINSGGKVHTPKYALPGMAWQGYYYDSEDNVFRIQKPDENAK